MLQFLNPAFLFAAAAAVVPLLLHLMQRNRTIRLPFSTIRFLKLAERRSSRRIRMENFLLWLMRTALMLLLAAAFAMPMLRTQAFGRFLSQTRRDVALVLDASYSMRYTSGRDTVWQKAVQTAASVVEGLADGDRVCVFLADDDVTPVIEQLTADKEYALAQLRSLQSANTPSQLAPAVLAAHEALTREGRPREREIHIISDGQALPWLRFARASAPGEPDAERTGTATPDAVEPTVGRDPAGAEAGAAEGGTAEAARGGLWQPDRIDKRTAFFVTLVGAPEPRNAAPVDVELEPDLIMSDMPFRLRVALADSGGSGAMPVTVYLNDQESARRALSAEGGAGDLTFSLPPLAPGVHAGRVEAPLDNLPPDDVFHFLVRVKERLPALCVGTPDDTFFLMRALEARLDQSAVLEAKQVAPAELHGEDLAAYSCVFLCNALPLPGQSVLELERFVEAGGLLAVFPGDRAAPADYKAWRCLPAVPAAIVETPRSDRKRALRWNLPRHALLRPLKVDPGDAPAITVRRELAWGERAPATEEVISLGAEGPFLLDRPYGDGRVLLFATTADRSWGTFSLSPFFLPLVHQTVYYGAGISGQRPYLQTARSLDLREHVPSAPGNAVLLDPAGSPVPVRSAIVENRTVLRVENLMEPGVYLLETDAGQAVPALAVNLDRSESDLTPTDAAAVRDSLGVRHVYVAESREDLQRLVSDYRVGRTLGEQVLWLALILAVIEVFYANRKAQSPPSLATSLGIASSGRMKSATSAPA